jgi:hypothetical protein
MVGDKDRLELDDGEPVNEIGERWKKLTFP